MTKVVVCYGDSNTWGADPSGAGRFPPDVRWTGVLQSALGSGYKVIEEGLNGRTTNIDDTIETDRNGRAQLPPTIESQRPFDLMIIMLGTNDLKARHNRGAADIAQSAAKLAEIARLSEAGPNGTHPRVLLMAPPATIVSSTPLDLLLAGSVEKSKLFPQQFAFYANAAKVDFFDAGSVIVSSAVDGIHFDAAEHEKLGNAVAVEVRRILDN